MSENNQNKVELLGYYGDDQIIAQSAWTSTSRDLTPEKLERVAGMIVGLWADGHETPYEKASVHFLVDTDIASHIHLLKHRISHMNGESARYKELKEDKMYLPADWEGIKVSEDVKVWTDPVATKDEISNFASGDLEFNGNVLEEAEEWIDVLRDYTDLGNRLYHQAIKDLEPKLGRKRAKESARFFKSYNSQIQADIQFNLRSFANFLRLRDSEHAQKEIRDIAQQMHIIVSEIEDEPFKAALWVITRANELWTEAQERISKQIKLEFKELKKDGQI